MTVHTIQSISAFGAVFSWIFFVLFIWQFYSAGEQGARYTTTPWTRVSFQKRNTLEIYMDHQQFFVIPLEELEKDFEISFVFAKTYIENDPNPYGTIYGIRDWSLKGIKEGSQTMYADGIDIGNGNTVIRLQPEEARIERMEIEKQIKQLIDSFKFSGASWNYGSKEHINGLPSKNLNAGHVQK